MSALREVLGLLAPGDEQASEGESYLLTSILQSSRPLDAEAKTLVDCGGKDDLGLLVEVIAASPTLTVCQNFTKWSQILTLALQTSTSPNTLQLAHRGLHSLLLSVSTSPQSLDKSGLQAVPPLVQSLLSFSAPPATPPLQAQALRLVSHCLVHFNSSCSQHRQALRKWVGSAVFHTHSHLSQEASRVLVLLCRHSNQHWGHLVAGMVGGLQWVLRRLHRTESRSGGKSEGEELPGSVTAVGLAPPTVPPAHPERTGVLLQMLTQLARTLCYCLLFPPRDSAHTPRGDSSHLPSVPIESVLALVSEGLKPAASGHTVEALVLQVTIPVVHAAMWHILCVLIETCHAHLLPYGPHIQWMLVTALCSKDTAQSPRLLTAVHRTLAAWVGVARDCDTSFLTSIFHSLLGTCDHAPLRHSSLKTLTTLVALVGPLLTPPLATPTLRLAMEGLSPSPAPPRAVPLLYLLRACLSSRNRDLTPPPSSAIRLLTDLTNHHTAAEVVALSHSCLHELPTNICHAPSHTSTETPSTSLEQHSQATPPALPLVPHLQAPPTSLVPHPQAPPTSPSPVDLMALIQNQRRSKRGRSEELDVVSDSKRSDLRSSEEQSQEESSLEEVSQPLKSLVDTSVRSSEETELVEVDDRALEGEDKTLGNGGGNEVGGENLLLKEDLLETGSSSDSDAEGSGVDYFVPDSPTSSE